MATRKFKGVKKLSEEKYNELKQQGLLDNSYLYVTPKTSLKLIDSDTIVVMTEDSGTTLHLSVDLLNEITRSLKIPVAKPATTELVGFDENKSQVNIEIGEGLSLENGVLKVTGIGDIATMLDIINGEVI